MLPNKKKPAKADTKQQTLPFGAGTKITSEDERQQEA